MSSVKCDFTGKDPNVYGKPWGAKLLWSGERLVYDFHSCQVQGEISAGGTIIIQAEVGSPVAFGQKNKTTNKSNAIYAIVGEKFGLDYCTYEEALKCAKKWYYEYGIGTKIPYRKDNKSEKEKYEKEKQEEEKPKEEELKAERLGVLKIRSGLFIMGDPDYIMDQSQMGFENKIQMMTTMLKAARNNAGNLTNKEFTDVGSFVMIDGEKHNAAEITVLRDENKEIKEINIKIK